MIYQPTNIRPDVKGGLGYGVCDLTNGLSIQWLVNGNSPLVAFGISISKNDAISTPLYNTGKLTVNCPFYGTDYAGEQIPFTYGISPAICANAGIVNGAEYKLNITQFYGDGDNDYITQSSASVFIGSAQPTITIDSFSNPLPLRSNTFTATYSQEQGEALNWVRWRIALADDTDNPFYDSGKIYGTAQLQVSYDGFFTGTSYAIRCDIETELGVDATTDWVTFDVEYTEETVAGDIVAECASGKSAIRVAYADLAYINGTATGDYSFDNYYGLILTSGSSVVWDTVNGSPMSLGYPWSILYRAKFAELPNSSVRVLDLHSTTYEGEYSGTPAIFKMRIYLMFRNSGAATLYSIERYSIDGGTTWVNNGSPNTLYTLQNVNVNEVFSIALSVNGLAYFYRGTDGLVKANGVTSQSLVTRLEALLSARGLGSIQMDGTQNAVLAQVEQGTTLVDSFIETPYNLDYYERPQRTDETIFFTNFYDKTLQAGTIVNLPSDVTSVALYREHTGDAVLKKIADITDVSNLEVYDYSARSQQGEYKYHLVPTIPTTYTDQPAPLVSNSISPTWWCYSILETAKDSNGAYIVQNEYRFGNNIESGAVGNNNAPNIALNFTRYPTIQTAPQNFKSGTLKSLIGGLSLNSETGVMEYSDTIALRDAIYALSTTTNTLFLKNRKGDLIMIKVGGAISMETADSTRGQIQTMELPWVEIGDAQNVTIISYQ